MRSGTNPKVSQHLLHMHQVAFALDIAECTAKIRILGKSWGMCRKYGNAHTVRFKKQPNLMVRAHFSLVASCHQADVYLDGLLMGTLPGLSYVPIHRDHCCGDRNRPIWTSLLGVWLLTNVASTLSTEFGSALSGDTMRVPPGDYDTPMHQR